MILLSKYENFCDTILGNIDSFLKTRLINITYKLAVSLVSQVSVSCFASYAVVPHLWDQSQYKHYTAVRKT